MPPYTYTDAVADGVAVDFDVYKINTRITSAGSRVESGFWIDKRDRMTRARRAELLDTDFTYTSEQLNRDVVAPDQIRIPLGPPRRSGTPTRPSTELAFTPRKSVF